MTPAGRGAGNRDHVALAPAAARRSAGGWLAAWAGCLLSLCGHRVAEAQEFQYTEITLSQYDAQKDYAVEKPAICHASFSYVLDLADL